MAACEYCGHEYWTTRFCVACRVSTEPHCSRPPTVGTHQRLQAATLNGRGKLLPPDSEVKEAMVQYFVQFDVHEPVDMSREELFTLWLEEARAAQGAVDAGAVTNLWKVVGQRSVFAVLDLPDHTSLDQALESLPIIQKLGSSVDTRAYAIRPYNEWAEELRVAVEGE